MIKNFFMIFYLFVNPLIMTPDWCLDFFIQPQNNKYITSSVFLDCRVAYDDRIIYSDIYKVKPLYSAVLDIICLLYFCLYRFLKT